MRNNNLICVISSLTSGGAEKVMAEIANQSSYANKVTLVILSRKEKFYKINPRVKILEPSFTIDQMPRLLFKWRNFRWLRKTLKRLPAKPVLSFSGKYNAFVLLASYGLGKKVFISDRSRPGISYGKFLDLLNPITYRLAAGIVAQTSEAEKIAYQQTRHKNIQVIPNPIELPRDLEIKNREKLIINIGRFIASKHQDWLIDYFEACNTETWNLAFLGDGQKIDTIKSHANQKRIKDRIAFQGNVKHIHHWYARASIFAFTSTSEGFPNALAEAMAHGCACIAYDCLAGPSDIIDDGVNGFLIPMGDHELYQKRLSQLMKDENLRIRFGKAAVEKMELFSSEKIIKRYLDFIIEN